MDVAGKKCPECGSSKLIRDYERGEIICSECGLIVAENVMDEGPEWRAFDSEQAAKRARGGAPVTYMRANKGLVTEIDQYNRDIRGTKISGKKQAQLYRMRKWHKRASISSSVERNLAIALSELDRISSYLGLPENIREAAALLYRKCVERGLIRGRLIESVVSAVIYAICRDYGIPRTLDEIAKVSGMEKKEIGRTFRFIARELNIRVPLSDPSSYVPRFVSSLGLGGAVQERAIALLKKAMDKGIVSGRGPTGVAAAAVYIAVAMSGGKKKTQKEVADVAGVTEVTIRNRYREMRDALKLKMEEK
ncbi:MAG: transcription initiation factor IIB [Candidatus Micrarchaeota archaeon]